MARHPHRVTRAVAGVRSELSSVAEVPLWSMDTKETAATIADLQAAKAQLAELEARLLIQAEAVDLPGQTGATSTANWLAHRAKLSRPAAHRAVHLAHGLDAHEQTRAAMAEGKVQREQAQVIVRALDDLPDGLDPRLVHEAEAHLITEAKHFDPVQLKRIGRRSSRSSTPTPPTPTKPPCSSGRNATPKPPPG